ncbi:MAG: NAD(P)/FAD-dependent oxidoreductase [Acidobacteriaceae bacterium]|nr:NAD(P)/FAD-dependent oxidoreductase [Acidobacteriaceae bacterium]
MRRNFDVLVVGAGPAGLAAATSAARVGAKVGVVDDNPAVGGQIWRGEVSKATSDASNWAAKLHSLGVEVICGAQIVHHDIASRVLFAETRFALLEIRFSKLILATGARERLLPFPGWTLPNVMAAGGLQAMVKSGLPISGKRVVVAGSGPLLLAVAAYLRAHGAKVLAICEQASWNSLASFASGLLSHPGKLRQALILQRQLLGIPFWTNSWPVRALGREALERIIISRNGTQREISCDYLACGFHLVPNVELASLLGCALEGGCVRVDDAQQTSVAGVFCAGEPTGIGGLELALIEGQIAGIAAAGKSERLRELRGRRRKAQQFARRLEKAFKLRPELKTLPDSGTIVCRCEDVTHARLARHSSWRDAKNQTRCGMGPCQGRICGPATQFLFDWDPGSVRPPLFPTRVESLASVSYIAPAEHSQLTGERQ